MTRSEPPAPRPRSRSGRLMGVVLALVALAACGPGGPGDGGGAPRAEVVLDYAGTEVTFDGRGSTGVAPLDFRWSFGDGATAAGPLATHRYTAPGSYLARLTVTDASGARDVATRELEVGVVAGGLEVRYGDAAATSLRPRARFEPRADAPYAAGEVVVLFAEGVRTAAAGLEAAGTPLAWVRDLALPGAALYRAAVAPAGLALQASDPTWDLVRALRARPDVVDAHPNYVLQPFRVPNDPDYALQWNLPAIGMEEAWGITTGDEGVIVAVLDTGILADPADPARTHPDLRSQVVPGYDFVSVVTYANDGDGRDPDPYDPGDTPGGLSSYHGSHVAGTIAARSDDGVGTAGVAWRARLLPVRVLGAGGGLFSDVLDGLLWAAGRSVAGVPTNAHPARVANLSLGGLLPCGALFQAAIDEVVADGVTVVVAAGNEATGAERSFPANCANVIAVGATDRAGDRAWYSNHGPRIDLMAPGGDTSGALADGVYGPWRDDATGRFGHTYAEGTSMAAPHVAGVAALMLALEPDLEPDEVRALLRLTARPLTAAACRSGHPEALAGGDCGAGLVDAAAALRALDGAAPTTPGELAFAPGTLDFGADLGALSLRLTNAGGSPLAWRVVGYDEASSNPGPVPAGALTVAPASGDLAAGAQTSIEVRLDRSFVDEPGAYLVELVVAEDGAERSVPVRFQVGDDVAVLPQARLYVGTFTVEGDDDVTVYGLTTYASPPTSYEVLSMAGRVRVLAWLDTDGSGRPDGGDFVGEFASSVSVAGGATVEGVDLLLEPFVAPSTAASVLERFLEASPQAP
jgi:serine protease